MYVTVCILQGQTQEALCRIPYHEELHFFVVYFCVLCDLYSAGTNTRGSVQDSLP